MREVRTAKGSIWRKWDMHIHSPASFNWKGTEGFKKLSSDAQALVLEAMVKAMNASDVAVFTIMDYWTFDGYHLLREFLSTKPKGYLTKTVLPGIELRVQSPTDYRLNAHGVFSEKLTKQELEDFKSQLRLVQTGRQLSDDALAEFARKEVKADKLSSMGKQQLDLNIFENAFNVAAECAEVSSASFQTAFKSMAQSTAVIFMPFDTYNGLSPLDWKTHYAASREFFSTPAIFETRKWDTRCAFVGIETEGNTSYFSAFQQALEQIARLAVSGSDAHAFKNYGRFPRDSATWIKAEPSFQGLLQAIKEPASRSHIGNCPPKLTRVSTNPTHYLDELHLTKRHDALSPEKWFDGQSLELNHDLVAIIGNKGSGKSALADILALMGDASNAKHFSFLKTGRFRDDRKNWASDFHARGVWVDGTNRTVCLAEDPESSSVERIKYIPQAYFEELCNEQSSGKVSRFEQELRNVIFSHIDVSERSGSASLDDLIRQREHAIEKSIASLRNDLNSINQCILRVETRLTRDAKQRLLEELRIKEEELAAHDKAHPLPVSPPPNTLSPNAAVKLEELLVKQAELARLGENITSLKQKRRVLIDKRSAVQRVKETISELQRQISQIQVELTDDLRLLGIPTASLFKFSFDLELIDVANTSVTDALLCLDEELDSESDQSIPSQFQKIESHIARLRNELDEPNRKYQEYLNAKRIWDDIRSQIRGDSLTPKSHEYVKREIEELSALPEELIILQRKRTELARTIFLAIDKRRKIRESLYAPVQALIDSHDLIRDEFRLQFRSFLDLHEFELKFFDLIKKSSGSFRGDDEGRETLRALIAKFNMQIEQEALELCDTILDAVKYDITDKNRSEVNIERILRTSKTPLDFYNFLFGFEYLEPKYTLLLAETPIEKLSPGQRGALLLIFYLLVDRDPCPIILDQPEENLDNETIFKLLVPVIKEAKEHRQIIMVTHNANLAVVCDAEQIIHATFEGHNLNKVSYFSGAIEDDAINSKVVTVLEGTKPAFNNRRGKYFLP